jgi:hypothetical protein
LSTDIFSQVRKKKKLCQRSSSEAAAASLLSRVGGARLFLKQTNQVDEKL